MFAGPEDLVAVAELSAVILASLVRMRDSHWKPSTGDDMRAARDGGAERGSMF